MPLPWTDAEAADLAECRTLLCAGSRSFHAASRLLPVAIRDPAIALYAFCRVADDAIDCDGPGQLGWLRERLALIYAGRPLPLVADRAFARIVERFAIPRDLPEALLEGFAWDAEGRRYPDLAGVRAYSVRVAGTVGAMMAVLMGVRDPERLAAAVDLGVGMQLSNIARDVGEDARAGRLYLPVSWLRDAGIDPAAWLARPAFTAEIAAIVQRLLGAADALYGRATLGIASLPLSCRPGIHLARALYAEIGRELERGGLDSIARRAVVSSNRKFAVAARTLAFPGRLWAPARKPAAMVQLDQTLFLIEAVAATPPRDALRRVRAKPIEDRLVWVIDLFARLERRDQLLRGGSFR